MFLCCPISVASGSHFLLATNHSAFILTAFADAKVILSQVAGHLLLLKSSNYSRLVSKEILCIEIQIVLFNKFNTKIALYSRHFTSRFHVFVYQAACNLCHRSLQINFRLSPYPAKSHRLVGCFNSKSYNTAHVCHFVFSVSLLLRLTE